MKNLAQKFAQLAAKYKPKCDPSPGKWNSCEPCKDCGKRAKYPEYGGTPCCGLINPPIFFPDASSNGTTVSTNDFTIPALNCPTEILFTPYLFGGLDPLDFQIYIVIDSVVIPMTWETTYPATFLSGENIYFTFSRLPSSRQNGCCFILIQNYTCNSNAYIGCENICLTK